MKYDCLSGIGTETVHGTNIMDFKNLWISSFFGLFNGAAIFEFVSGGTFYKSGRVT